jgi:hypothetical protein
LGGRACGRGGTLAGGDHLTGPAPTMLGCAGTAVEYGIGGVAATWFSAYAGACMTLDSWPDGNSGRPGRLAPGRRSGRPGGWLIAVRREGNSVPHSRADHALAGKGVRVIAGAAGGPLATGGIERAPLEDRPHPRAPGARSRPPRLDQDGRSTRRSGGGVNHQPEHRNSSAGINRSSINRISTSLAVLPCQRFARNNASIRHTQHRVP